MMRLNNSLANNLANITPAGNTAIQAQSVSVCAKRDMSNTTAAGTFAYYNLSNLTTSGKHTSVDLALPGTIAVQMSVPTVSGTTFTAQSSGWVLMGGYASSTAARMNITCGELGAQVHTTTNGEFIYVNLPVVRNSVVSLAFQNIRSSTDLGAPAYPTKLVFIQSGGG